MRDRQGGTAAGVAVELGEHDAGEVHAVEEGLRGGDRVLADHRVDDEQDLVRVDRGADVRGLLHQLGVDAQAAGGVDDDDVVLLLLGVLDRVLRHLHRVADTVARLRAVEGHAGALGDHLELVDRVGALEVAGDQQRGVLLLLQPVAELAREGGLTGTLQTGEHDDRRAALGEPHPAGLATEDRDELLVDDLDDLLGRVQRTGDLGTECPLLDLLDEGPDDRQRDVRLQQRDADLAGGGVDVRLAQAALAPEVLERRCEAIGKGVEHVVAGPLRHRYRYGRRPPGYPAAPGTVSTPAPAGFQPSAARTAAATSPARWAASGRPAASVR